jgi:hypothetical protein
VLCRWDIIRGKKMGASTSRSRIGMQPMRRLKGTSKKVPIFLLGGGGGGFLILVFPSYFQPVLTCSKRYSSGFQCMFPKFAMCSSRVFPIAPHFISYPLPNSSPFLTYIMTQMRGTPSSYRNYYLGQPPKFQFLLAYGPIKWPIAKKKNLGGSPSNE